MSHASAAVLFRDGTIRYGIYSGTSDIMGSCLFGSIDEAWDDYRSPASRDEAAEAADEPVIIYSDYGGGFSWPGRATRDRLTDGFDPFGQCGDPAPMIDGEPLWLRWDGAVVVGGVVAREIEAG
jgi:hypothetical protein